MNVYLPAESVEDKQRSRFLDWRFLAALAVLVLLAFLVYAGFRNYEIREAEAAQKDALIEQLADRSQQIETLERDIARLTDRAREDRQRSSEERATLLRQQRRMIRLLQRFGITPPVSSGGSDAAAMPATPDSQHKSERPVAPAPSTSPARDERPPRQQGPPNNPPPPAPEPPADPPPFDWLPTLPLPELPAL